MSDLSDRGHVEGLKARAAEVVDELAETLLDVSHRIHERPELGYEERFAHEVLTSAIERAGTLTLTPHAYGLDTAFDARAGSEGVTVAVCCEYDALPGLGHACGHNVIAAAGLGAGLALAAIADEAGGRVVVLGTPAEEGGGGKIAMIEQGALDGIDAAMMVHPADADLVLMSTLAIQQLEVTYEGKAAHAAAFPWEGRNALDAAVLGYMNVAALRQHIEPDERVHGIFTKAGDKPNIVPRETASAWYVRSPSKAGLDRLTERVLRCLHAGADAAGCTCNHTLVPRPYLEMRDSGPMMAAYASNAARTGRTLADPRAAGAHRVVGSTDMGNISYVVPAIHPMVQVAPAGTPIHSPEFAGHARSAAADRAVVDAAKAMAMTAIDLWAGSLLAEARAAHG